MIFNDLLFYLMPERRVYRVDDILEFSVRDPAVRHHDEVRIVFADELDVVEHELVVERDRIDRFERGAEKTFSDFDVGDIHKKLLVIMFVLLWKKYAVLFKITVAFSE